MLRSTIGRAAVTLGLLHGLLSHPALRAQRPEDRTAPAPVPVPPSVQQARARGTRTADGLPGPRLWRPAIRYELVATLDVASARLQGEGRVIYRNGSPDTLRTLVLNLYQNIFAPHVPRNRYVVPTGGLTLARLEVDGRPLDARSARDIPVLTEPPASAPVGYAVQGTLARLVLPRPLAPGDSVTLRVAWSFPVPPVGNFRTGWEDAFGGRAFVVAQWYPQVAVYDDLRGWDATPYLGDGEFYLDWADFDVRLRVPRGVLVGATGELVNAADVLAPATRLRLAAALRSDSALTIVAPGEAARATASADTLEWHFRARQVRDFAFAASAVYRWDARPYRRRDGTVVLLHAFYRPGAPHWTDILSFAHHAVSFFERWLPAYPYPQLTLAEGPIGGMEYPMLVFLGRPADRGDLYAVTAHEIAHQWFPMMVGQDEAAYAWMDEGFATFLEDRARADFFPGSRPQEETRRAYLAVAGTEREVPLMRHTDLVSPYGARTVAAYSKPAVLLETLRALLGPETFDAVLRRYATVWAFRHPTPWDFFAFVDRATGQNLDWFWRPWWFDTGVLDQAIVDVQPRPGGVRVILADHGSNPMPTRLRLTLATGATLERTLPTSVWFHRRTVTLDVPVPSPVVEAQLDPDNVFPDANPRNNRWVRASMPTRAAPVPSARRR